MNAGFGARFFLGAAFLAAFFGAALRALVFLAAVFLAAFFGAAFLALVAVFLAAGRLVFLLAERFAGFAFAFFADFFAAITISECVKGTENDVGRKISYTLCETVCKRFLSGEMMIFLWGNDVRVENGEKKHYIDATKTVIAGMRRTLARRSWKWKIPTDRHAIHRDFPRAVAGHSLSRAGPGCTPRCAAACYFSIR